MSYKTARVSKCAPRNGTKRQKKKIPFSTICQTKIKFGQKMTS